MQYQHIIALAILVSKTLSEKKEKYINSKTQIVIHP